MIDVIEIRDAVVPPTETKTRRQRVRERFGLPWPKTTVGDPLFDDDLLLVNRTDLRWFVYLDWHALDVLQPHETRVVPRGRTARVTARLMDGPVESPFLWLDLPPATPGVEVLDASGGERFYQIRPIEPGRKEEKRRRDSTPITELDVSAGAIAALELAGVTTFGDLRRAEVDVLLDLMNRYPRIKDEIIRLIYLLRSGL